MKGLSVKKIAALAAGTAILGASLAVADVMYGNTQLVLPSGQPVAKVVVGKNAAASDGVVAANIAAVLGNNAYSKQTISATYSGTATCETTVSGGAGAGSCPVSNEKVVLEVTLPGVVSGSASFKTYVNDYVDKYTEDRQESPEGVGNNYSTTTEIKPCFTGSFSSGHVNSTSAEVADPSDGCEHGRKISGGDFPPMSTVTVRDTYSGDTYTEEQSLWVYGETVYDEVGKTVVADHPNVGYKVDFTHDTYGLPTSTCTNYGGSDCTSPNGIDDTERHRVTIKFLGEDWIISDMNAPGMSGFNTSAYIATVGDGSGTNSISLAKESAYGIVHIGENLTAGAYTIKLADIGLATGSNNEHPAAIEIFDANGVLVKEDQISTASGTYSWSAPDGSKLKIRVYQTQPGYTLASKWAEMAVYSNELTLTNNVKIDNVDNPLWIPHIYWSHNPNNNNVTTLKTLILARNPNDASTVGLKLQKGDSLDVITTPSKFQYTFDGINLGSADYDSLALSVSGTMSLSYGTSCGSSTSSRYLQVVSGLSNAFTVAGTPVSNFYIDLGNINGTNNTYVYYQQSGSTCFTRTSIGVGSTIASYNLGDGVTQNLIVHAANGTNANFSMKLEERASTTTSNVDYLLFELDNVTDTSWAFTGTSTQTKGKYMAAYAGPAGYSTSSWKSIDPGFVTERGSVFSSLTSKAAVVKVAKKIAEATYYVNSVGSTPGGATEITLAEGEEWNGAEGTKIKVKSITETVGSCTATGGEGSCTVDMSPVKAVLSTNDESADVITPYKVMGDLVVMDEDAGNVAVKISVGGHMVNTVTADALGSDADSLLSKSGDYVVREVGNTIVVAGYSSDDTKKAGNEFISGLTMG